MNPAFIVYAEYMAFNHLMNLMMFEIVKGWYNPYGFPTI